MRSILCGSAPLDPWMIRASSERYGIEVVNAFGSTEGMTFMSGPTITADPHRRARYFPRFRGAATDAGATTGTTASRPSSRPACVDPETGAEIDAPRQPGELVFRSPALFPGYWTAERTSWIAATSTPMAISAPASCSRSRARARTRASTTTSTG